MASSTPDLTSRLLRHERLLIGGGIALLAALSWWFVIAGGGMGRMDGMAMAPPLAAVVLMWWLMMAAMMLPAAAPSVLLYAQVRRRELARGSSLAAPWTFLAGYLLVWLLFSLTAAALQGALTGPAMRLDDKRAQAGVLIAAGLYQLSPLKGACLRQCQSPAQFFARHWRPGPVGALRLGLLHGAYCVGCCWMLMAILFVGGVMNLALVAALTLLVSAEKLLPGGRRVAYAAAAGLIGWGGVLLLA
jgi:predicted metal-binding membrane protein